MLDSGIVAWDYNPGAIATSGARLARPIWAVPGGGSKILSQPRRNEAGRGKIRDKPGRGA